MMVWHVLFLGILAGVSASTPEIIFPETYNDRVASRQSSRIVSGWEAEDGQFPHQLSMRMISATGLVGGCGGSIIHEEWGLTAAHCTATRVTMMLRAGGANMTRPLYLFETTEYYNHPEYNANLPSVVQPNDIALLKFPMKLVFSSRVQPIRLQPSEDMNRDYSGEVLIASGWGNTWTQGSSPEVLNWVYLRGISNQDCLWWYSWSPIIVDSTICAQYYNVTSQSTCQGDSGGPLTVYDLDGGLTQVGISSFVSGSGCHTEHPAGFARPGPYHKWFSQVTGVDLDWSRQQPTELPEPTTEGELPQPEPESEEVTIQPEPDSEEVTIQPEPETEETTFQPEAESVGPTYQPELETFSTTTQPESGSTESNNLSQEESDECTSSSSEEEDEEALPLYMRFRNDGVFGILL